MREGWELVTLKDVCSKGSSNITQRSINDNEGQYSIYGASGLIKKVDFYQQEKPYIGIVKDGSGYGRIMKLEAKSSVIGTLQYLIPNEDIDINYFYYFLLGIDFRKYVQGAAIPHIYFKDYKDESFLKLPLPEQKQIVAILDKAFAAIDQAQANIEKNIENAKELFENWTFQTIKNANWNKLNWGEVCDFTRGPFGGSLKKSMFVESGYAVYEQKQPIHNDYNALRYFIDEEKFQEMKRFEVKPADLLMSCSGVTLGRISEVPEDAPKGIINQALLKLTAKPDKVLNDFLVIWIRSKIFQDLIFKVAGGAAQPNVPGVKILKNIKLPCPTITEQEDFIELHDTMKEFTQNSITANIRKNESLEELKKSILQRAFSGELTQKPVTV